MYSVTSSHHYTTKKGIAADTTMPTEREAVYSLATKLLNGISLLLTRRLFSFIGGATPIALLLPYNNRK